MRNHPQSVIDKVYEFLGVRSEIYPPDIDKKVLKGINRKEINDAYCISETEYRKILSIRKEDHCNKETRALDEWMPLFSREEVRRLEEFYRDDTGRLKELLNMELSCWS